MMKRIIPTLLIKDAGLVKTQSFKKPSYVGDPINAVKIFNDKGVDELVILDIEATKQNRIADLNTLKEIVSEAFMPIGYGGGISTIQQVEFILKVGIEKVIINTAAYQNPQLISNIVEEFGSSTIVGSMDIKENLFGNKRVFVKNASLNTKKSPIEYAKYLENLGVGELMITDVENDGKLLGYNTPLFSKIADSVNVPVIASGGAKNSQDILSLLLETNVSAAAAGATFVYHGKHRAVLINYPDHSELNKLRNYNEEAS